MGYTTAVRWTGCFGDWRGTSTEELANWLISLQLQFYHHFICDTLRLPSQWDVSVSLILILIIVQIWPTVRFAVEPQKGFRPFLCIRPLGRASDVLSTMSWHMPRDPPRWGLFVQYGRHAQIVSRRTVVVTLSCWACRTLWFIIWFDLISSCGVESYLILHFFRLSYFYLILSYLILPLHHLIFSSLILCFCILSHLLFLLYLIRRCNSIVLSCIPSCLSHLALSRLDFLRFRPILPSHLILIDLALRYLILSCLDFFSCFWSLRTVSLWSVYSRAAWTWRW